MNILGIWIYTLVFLWEDINQHIMFINFIAKYYHHYSLPTNIIQKHNYLDTTLIKTKEKNVLLITNKIYYIIVLPKNTRSYYKVIKFRTTMFESNSSSYIIYTHMLILFTLHLRFIHFLIKNNRYEELKWVFPSSKRHV